MAHTMMTKDQIALATHMAAWGCSAHKIKSDTGISYADAMRIKDQVENADPDEGRHVRNADRAA